MTEKRHRYRFLGISFLFVIAFLTFKFYSDPYGSFIDFDEQRSDAQLSSSCIQCHGQLKGFSESHSELDCTTCHGGDNKKSDTDSSHQGMRSIPGNMHDAEESCALCHPQAFSDIQTSLMTSNSGIISVDRYIFGESNSPDELAHIHDLGHSAADTHLRNLCSHCHLGNKKKEFGPITEQSRGGGCNACHLNYTPDETLLKDSLYHPSLTLNVSDDHCFGCHSRSGRIATNYEGWHETLIHKDSIPEKGKYRVLLDERVFSYVKEDIHHSAGMECIDCHNYEDIMGDGKNYAHEEDAVKISCEDCHFSGDPLLINYEDLNFTHLRILKLRKNENQIFLATSQDSTPLLNTLIDKQGKARLQGKSNARLYDLAAPSALCTKDAGHQNVSCAACHNQWAPQCLGCHSDFDPNASGYDLYTGKEMKGSWIEYAGEFLAEQPALGVKGEGDDRRIQAAIPGMIMTLDKNSFTKRDEDLLEFHRLYSQASPHTIGKEGRSCTSCHSDPLAIGYGRGKLEYKYEDDPPHWEFEAEYTGLEDGLPSDAWIGFLQELDNRHYSTRTDFLPFNLEEQQRILTIGACFSCHKEDAKVMVESLSIPFLEYRKRMSEYCIMPLF